MASTFRVAPCAKWHPGSSQINVLNEFSTTNHVPEPPKVKHVLPAQELEAGFGEWPGGVDFVFLGWFEFLALREGLSAGVVILERSPYGMWG